MRGISRGMSWGVRVAFRGVRQGDEEGGIVNFGHRAGCMIGLSLKSDSLFVLAECAVQAG